MIDSLLFLPDVDAAATVDPSTDHIPCDDGGDAAAAAAVAASRDGHAHAARAAWVPALAALERSAIARAALVGDGLAGPLVAARGWSDLATAYAASGDVVAARRAQAQAAGAAADATIPADLAAALDELHAVLGPATPVTFVTPAAVALAEATDGYNDSLLGDLADGLLWLDTTEDVIASDAPLVEAPVSAATTAAARSIEPAVGARSVEERADGERAISDPAPPPTPTTPQRATSTRIAAVDAAVALAEGDDPPAHATGGIASRLRRLLRR